MSTTFHALGAPSAIAQRLAERGIESPFPIQSLTLPDALAGRDLCGKAPTGSGKTLAFGIPLVARLHSGRSKPRQPRALVLVPTRELAAQVAREIELIAGRKGPSVATFYGGVGFGAQLAALRKGVDIAVACPGRLADLVARTNIDLRDVEMVVLDEADRMADMGFLPEVRRLLDMVRDDRQTLLFSATLDGDIDGLVKHYQRNPARHELDVDEDAPQLRHVFWKVEHAERVELTAQLVSREWPAIVFTRTKHGADRLAKQLGRHGVSAVAIHGDRSQSQRDRALADFTKGKAQALIATDVAARGIHVDDVAAVVHFDLPGSTKDYVHRAGRTGRAGNTGLVVTLVDKQQSKAGEHLQGSLGFERKLHWPDIDALGSERHDARVSTSPPSSSFKAQNPKAQGPKGQGPKAHRPGNARPARRRRPERAA